MTKLACVFGGSGFLGSHVADKLTELGFKVRLFDKKSSEWLKNGQEMIIGNLLNQQEVDDAVSGAEIVYNFAAISDLNEGLVNPLGTVQVNILGNNYVLDACRKYNVQRFIFASTVYVYGREGGFYRCSKQACESYIEEYHKIYGLDYTILRYGSLYGPRADLTNGLYRIIKRAIETGVISYEGSAESLREYIHVDDAAVASVIALGDEFCNQSIVITGQELMRVEDLLKMLAEIMGPNVRVEFNQSRQEGHYVRTPYAYQPKLGKKYSPPFNVDIGQGLIELIQYVSSKNKL